jgi:hypothetical protein
LSVYLQDAGQGKHAIISYRILSWTWDVVVSLALVITLIRQPLIIAYIDETSYFEHIFTLCVGVLFMLDIIVNFRTGIVSKHSDTITLDGTLIVRYAIVQVKLYAAGLSNKRVHNLMELKLISCSPVELQKLFKRMVSYRLSIHYSLRLPALFHLKKQLSSSMEKTEIQ